MMCAALVVTVMGMVATVLVLSTSFVGRGLQLLLEPPRRRWTGSLLVAAGLSLPVACCYGPSVAFRLQYETPPLGRFPDGVIEKGMTAEEVRTRLGAPHTVNDRHRERVYWHYWLDAIFLDGFRVYFGVNGTVESTQRE